MNGGMYQNDLRPVGLYIENGRELTPANAAAAPACPARYRTSTRSRTACSSSVTAKRASSRRASFLAKATSELRHAVRPDARHRRRYPSSLYRQFSDRKPRNGVGIEPPRVHFVITGAG